MEDNRAFESQEQTTARIETTEAAVELEVATFEPEARVEAVESFEQAEAVQTAFVAVVDAAATQATDEASVIPINIPDESPEGSGGEVSTLPLPIPDPSSQGAIDEVSSLPLPIPDPATAGEELPSGMPGGEVSATPITIPDELGPDRETPPVASATDEVSATPITLPGQAMPVEDEVPTGPSTDEVSATPITLPGQAITEGDRSEGITEAHEGALPEALHQEQVPDMEGRMPEGDLSRQMPGGFDRDLPGGLSDGLDGLIPGDFGFSDIPGRSGWGQDMPGSDGSMPGTPGWGQDMPGYPGSGSGPMSGPGYGQNIPGYPGSGSGPMDGMGYGQDIPGHPGSGGSFPGDYGGPGGPRQGELMDGGGGGGGAGGIFWSWNMLPGQHSRYEHARELTQMGEANSEDIGYEENWTPDPAVGSGDIVDPFTGNYEEWGTPTSSDYDETDKDRENFAEQQRIMEEEKIKQQEAKDKRESDDDDDDDDNDDEKKGSGGGSGAAESSPVDGEEGGGGAPISAGEHIHWERLGGLLVFDPPSDDMTSSSGEGGAVDPGGISQLATTPVDGEGGGGGGAPMRDTPKVDPSHVTDPVPGEQGKKATNQNM